MNKARAIALIQYRFPGAVETVDTSSAGPGIVVDPLGRCWPDRCHCARHSGLPSATTGHPAKPIPRPTRS